MNTGDFVACIFLSIFACDKLSQALERARSLTHSPPPPPPPPPRL